MADVKMVTVDGVRYREEDAPETKQVEPKNKARKPANKSADESEK